MQFSFLEETIHKTYLVPFILILAIVVFGLQACSRKDKLIDVAAAIGEGNHIMVVERYGRSLRGTMDGLSVLVLRGTYEQMGEAHGVLAGTEILKLLDRTLILYINKQKPNAWDDRMIPLARSFKFPDRYEIELAAIIKGIKIARPNVQDRMLSSVGREISIDDLRVLNCIGDIINLTSGGCSSFSAWGSLTEDGDVISGRNLDYREFPGKIPVMVLAREPSEKGRKATLEIGGPGYIGTATAMNADGVLAMVHDEAGLPAPHTGESIPRALVVRDALEAFQADESIEQVAQTFKHRPVIMGNSTHFSLPMHKSLSIPSPFVIEWDGNDRDDGATIRLPDPAIAEDAIVCTNHYVKRRSGETDPSQSSVMRFERLSQQLREFHDKKTKINFEQAAEMMDSVARHGRLLTYLSVVASPKTHRMIIAVTPAPGVPATEGKWIGITWNSVFGIN